MRADKTDREDPRTPSIARLAGAAACVTLLALAGSCEDSDPVAPEGSSITISASPQTAQPNVDVVITATVRSANGTRLPDQEVVFTTTNGALTPPAQTPILTDEDGQVTTILRTSQVATVTASSGTITASTTVQILTCALSNIIINLSTTNISNCTTDVDVTLVALDTTGGFCGGLPVEISSGPSSLSGFNELKGTFDVTQGITDANGEFMATFSPITSDCQQNCSLVANPGAPNGGNCAADFVGEDFAGTIISNPVTLRESVQ